VQGCPRAAAGQGDQSQGQEDRQEVAPRVDLLPRPELTRTSALALFLYIK